MPIHLMFLVHMHPNLFIPLTSLPSMVEWRLLEMQLRKQKRSHYKSVTFIVVVTLSEVYVLYFLCGAYIVCSKA